MVNPKNSIKFFLAKRKMTQLELAVRTGIAASNICNYIKGQRMSKETADRIAKVLRVRPSDLFVDYSKMKKMARKRK